MHTRAPNATSSPALRAATTMAVAVLLGLAIGGVWAVSQVRMAPSAVPSNLSAPGPSGKPRLSLAAGTHQNLQRTSSRPQWKELSSQQQQVLEPLQQPWNNMSELTKRRWMSLADGFAQLQPEDQDKLRKRMQIWANLSSQQRNQARLNFFTSRQLSTEDLQAKWDSYQALSDEEKRYLAAKAAPKLRGAATALRAPVKPKLATIPAANTPGNVANPPKIPQPPPAVLQPPPPPAQVTPVQTAPIVTPHAAPVLSLPPLGDNAPMQTESPQSGSLYSHPDFPPIHAPQ